MDQFTLLRYLCSLDINIDEIKLGGDGKIVEIDESMFAKVKHFKGKDLQRRQLWVFGMKERESGRCWLQIVKARDAATLLHIIYRRTLPKTIIYSDLWKAYSGITKIGKSFKHLSVNHSLNFKDPITGVHTNGIESIWRVAKMKIKQVGGIRRGHIQPYIHEFLWQQEIKCRGEDRFLAILNAIKNIFL